MAKTSVRYLVQKIAVNISHLVYPNFELLSEWNPRFLKNKKGRLKIAL
tara:strand:- start:32 stop:175 length:144 start_codon:yes stop_codon:yes gene_type:complete